MFRKLRRKNRLEQGKDCSSLVVLPTNTITQLSAVLASKNDQIIGVIGIKYQTTLDAKLMAFVQRVIGEKTLGCIFLKLIKRTSI